MTIYDYSILDREGKVIERYSPTYNPSNMEKDIIKII